ncbi:MAG: S8 family serine peptidase [Elainellaceae cyanobacterium]
MALLPSDPLFQEQWYLNNTGQRGRTPGIDLNVIDVWDDYTGQGVSIAIIDDGVERGHEDLSANFDSNPSALADYSYGREGAPFFFDDDHGTAVAGIIAAERNTVGGVGVAFNASITSFSYYDITEFDASPLERQSAFDISSNSWGLDNPFQSNFDLPSYEVAGEAIATAVSEGRKGRGTVFVWAAGNEFEVGASADYGSYESSRFTIAVAALDGDGVFAPYSVQGSSLLVSAFGDGDPGFNRPGTIVTTDRTGRAGYNSGSTFGELDDPNYTNQFNGTSSATPMVSGVVALMLEANPRLGYRDVQEILAYSARQNDPTQRRWAFNGATNWNGGGLHTNLNYGFGLVDAHAAVRMAESWTGQRTAANELSRSATSTEAMNLKDNALTTATLNIASPIQIDQVEIDIDLSHQSIEDLIITLVSADGTRSRLFDGTVLTDVFLDDGSTASFSEFADDPAAFTSDEELLDLGESYNRGIDFTFSSTVHWGETGMGDWQLEIEDTSAGVNGTLERWGIRLYGDAISSGDTYVYTDEFAQLASGDRQQLTDTAGRDTLNASAVTSNLKLKLNPGQTSTIAGQSLTLGSDTMIERAYGGDGNDKIRGSRVKNKLWGARGNDTLIGLNGNDVLIGGEGNDKLKGSAGNDRLKGNNGNDRLIGGSGNNRLVGNSGNDVLRGGSTKDNLNGGSGRDRLIGGSGNNTVKGGGDRDIFVLAQGNGKTLIRDFNLDQDRLSLGRGMRFGSLTFTQQGSRTAIRQGDDLVALLQGVQAQTLDSSQFV